MSVHRHRGISPQAALTIGVARLALKPLISLYPLRDWSVGPMAWIETIADRIGWMPKEVEVERIELAGVVVEKLVPTAATHRPDAAICYYHGGAFLMGGLATHRAIASALARALGVTVYNVGYRQLPEVGVATSVDDSYRVYRAIADSGRYRQIAVGGDSAGGYISAKVVELAHLDAAPAPAAYFGFSPLFAPTVRDGDPRLQLKDSYLSAAKLRSLRAWFDVGPVALRGEDDVIDVDPAVFPPAMVVAATSEMLRADAVRMHARLEVADRPADLHLFDGGVHAFPVLVGATPEAARAVKLTVDFVRAAFDASARRAA